MKKKELLKQLIAGFQAGLPVEVYPRELMLPVDSNKIITVPGVRRCGKSSLFLLVINQLISEKGIRKEQILFLNFDDERLQFDAENFDEILQAYRELYPDISLKDVYMFFDEIQMAEDWQPFVHRVYEQECRHIFITGSNSNMLSSELATSLRGRTLQYEEFPLSFREYCSFVGVDTNYYVPEYRARIVNAFKVYLHQGGFPEVSLAIPMLKDRILQEYFFVMLYKDLVERYEIKNPEPVRYFIKRVMSNLTKPSESLSGTACGCAGRPDAGDRRFFTVVFAAPFAVLSFYRGERDGGPLLWNRRWDFKTFFAVCEGGWSVRAGR